MAQLEVQVQKDHIESLANVSGVTALMEIIWNSLDADATEISIKKTGNELGIESIEISDNGHGITMGKALEAFGKLGGSEKKDKKLSPSNRTYHGEEGKGRYNAFGLGDLINFKSTYNENSQGHYFEIVLDRNHLNKPEVGELFSKNEITQSGVRVTIQNVNQIKANAAFSEENIKSIEQKLALYYQQYPTFKVEIDGRQLDFLSHIENEHIEEIIIPQGDTEYKFKIRVVEWSRSCTKKIYYCNESAISFGETNLGVNTSKFNISAYVTSNYISLLHRNNELNLAEMDPILASVFNETKKIIRQYILDRLHTRSADFIKELKEKKIYPYKEEPQGDVEKVTRQVFDIVALNINEYVPHFSEQEDVSKKLTLTLVKEALETDSSALRKIITEVINLPEEKINDLKDLLESTSLSDVIDTMKEVTDRLRILYELKLLVMDREVNQKVLERKNLHKIIEKETWIFGDEYVLGASDVNLKNVLKSHLEALGREDFESIVEDGDNTDLEKIPDVCLWKQYNNGKLGHFRNLVVELKRPTVNAGTNEYNQIMGYAQRVHNDIRFEKDKTEWTFILLVNDIKEEIGLHCEQQHRKFGHVYASDKLNVYIVKWGALFNEAETRHQYLKEKLNFNITENQEGLTLLNTRYSEYLPEELKTTTSELTNSNLN